jgi:hypothetical protein
VPTYFAWLEENRVVAEMERALEDFPDLSKIDPVKVLDVYPTRGPMKIFMNKGTQEYVSRILRRRR